MPVRAVLFDVGGPLDTEEESEALKHACLRAALDEHGLPIDDDAFAAASRWAVEAYAPDAYAAIAWRLSGGGPMAEDVHRRFHELFEARRADRDLFQPRAGMRELLEELGRSGIALGLAANQPEMVLASLQHHGLALHFAYTGVTGITGLRKPDARVFLAACQALGVEPDECIMVGDRIDNDIAPAGSLGMRSVLFRTGRHATQQPRWRGDQPDVEVSTVDELRAALELLRT